MNRHLKFYQIRKAIFILPVILILYFIFLKIAFIDVYTGIIQEDNLVENIQVLVYLLSSFLALSVAINFFKKNQPIRHPGLKDFRLSSVKAPGVCSGLRLWGSGSKRLILSLDSARDPEPVEGSGERNHVLKNGVCTPPKYQRLYGFTFLVLFLCFIFISGEEISWGQRVLNIKVPEYIKKQNVQKELTLHNIGIIHYLVYLLYALVGFYGAFGWLIFRKKIRNSKGSIIVFFIPDEFLIFYFFPVFILYLYYDILGFAIIFLGLNRVYINDNSFIAWRDLEPAELLFSLGCFFFMIVNKYRQKSGIYTNPR